MANILQWQKKGGLFRSSGQKKLIPTVFYRSSQKWLHQLSSFHCQGKTPFSLQRVDLTLHLFQVNKKVVGRKTSPHHLLGAQPARLESHFGVRTFTSFWGPWHQPTQTYEQMQTCHPKCKGICLAFPLLPEMAKIAWQRSCKWGCLFHTHKIDFGFPSGVPLQRGTLRKRHFLEYFLGVRPNSRARAGRRRV